MILARGGPAPADARRCGCATAGTPRTSRDDQYDTLADAARLPAAPALRHDRDDPGRAHRRAPTRPRCRHDGLRHAASTCTSVDRGADGEIVVGGEPRHHAVRRLPRRPRHDRRLVPRRLVPHRRPRPPRRPTAATTFDGRRSDVLKVAGENVSTVEVEQCCRQHPHVLEAAVVGRPDDDPRRGARRLRRASARRRRSRRRVAELEAWCAERLAQGEAPARHHRFVDELPRTSVGKIRKFLLAATSADRTKQTERSTQEHEMTALDDTS